MNVVKLMNDKPLRFNRMPSVEEIDRIPLTRAAEFELSEKETKDLRRHLYAVNKDGIRRYRTLREHNILMVWRIK